MVAALFFISKTLRQETTRSEVPGLLLLGIFLFTAFVPASPAQQVTVTGKVELLREGLTKNEDSSGAVVWLTRIGEPAKPQSAPGTPKQQLVQKNKSFSPHVVVVQVGSTVAFPNRDPFFHNVFSLFEGKRFDLGLYEAGSSRNVLFDRVGISYIFCNIHPEMSGVVVAVNTPYYGISNSRGTVSIGDVPSGRYELHVWHERGVPDSLDSQVRPIFVSENLHSFGVLRVEEQRNAPAAHKNKYGEDYEKPSPAAPIYPHP
jgi:plastocyanin